MDQERWKAVDGYFTKLLARPDGVMDTVLAASAEAGLPGIHVSAPLGKLLMLLVRACGAQRVLEIGTLGGYSAIWLARGLGERGRVVTLEADAKHVDVARRNIERAGLSGVVDVRPGRAVETLAELAAEGAGPFDLIFIDADKPGYPDYLEGSLRLARRGSVILADNVVRKGAVIDSASSDDNVRGVRRFSEMLASDPRLEATAIQTVGGKGYDGFVMAVVTGEVLSAGFSGVGF